MNWISRCHEMFMLLKVKMSSAMARWKDRFEKLDFVPPSKSTSPFAIKNKSSDNLIYSENRSG